MNTNNIKLCFEDVCFQYPGSGRVVSKLGFSVARGERLAILGESGTGKSTILRLIAGLEKVTDGCIWVNGNLVSSPQIHVQPSGRGVGMVFQEWAVFPHLSVFENVAFGLSRRGKTEQEKARVMHLLQIFEILELANRSPQTLSGGQLQRVACARALAQKPEILLLDEAFSSLDSKMRERVRGQVLAALKRENTTSILVTHSGTEARAFADRVLTLAEGLLVEA
jgi:iron(III) transport system ATP-binding protein